MDGDLSLSRSFGGLRIANPDDASPPASRDIPDHSYTNGNHADYDPSAPADPPPPPPPPVARDARISTEPQTQSRRRSIFNLLRGEGTAEAPRNPYPNAELRPYASSSRPELVKVSSGSSSRVSPATAKAYRQSMPLNHQAQQQAQFSPYQSNPSQNGSRAYPSSPAPPSLSGIYAAQPPPNAMSTRESASYRGRNEGPTTSMTESSSKRDLRAGTAMQAGVPSRELSHRERTYSQKNPAPIGNGPIPQRQGSRSVAGGPSDVAGVRSPSRSISSAYPGNGLPVMKSDEPGGAASVREEYDANGKPILRQVKKGVRDFQFGRMLGEGSYSTVMLATDRQTLKEYAVKVLDKKHIIKEKKIKYVNIERDTLNRLMEHPGIVRLYYTFQDTASLYYVLDIAAGGELLAVLKKIGSFDEECTRFYGAQILDAIEHMHNRGVIHRDLKPENVLLDDQMHIKITDFGTAKLLPDPRIASDPTASYDVSDVPQESTRARSFVGTAEYVSPELLRDKHACKASDLWAFGCIVYQLLTGRPPFKASNEYQTFQKIVGLEYEFPPGFPPAARDLVERLLVLDPERRLSIEHIKNHEFFDGIQWGRGLWRQKAPRLKPYVRPAQEPNIIKLSSGYTNTAPPVVAARQPAPSTSTHPQRPQPRIITELPPPTQLDIEWSPVLTRNNERILKLGNLMVTTSPMPHSPNSKNSEHAETHEKKGLSRFFGSSTHKKRQRLVMVTSSARIILAAAGGDEKKTKSEISLLASECSWRTQLDSKGQEVWCVDTRGTHYSFEDTKTSVTTGDPSKSSAQEWLESLERAKDIALSQSMGGSYSSDGGFDMASNMTNSTNTLHASNIYPEGFGVADRSGRNILTKSQASLGDDASDSKSTSKRSHRFSKRASKNGLSTPF